MNRQAAKPVELARLRSWLLAAKGRRTFTGLARQAAAGKLPASYVPGRGITTRAGLAAAMEKVREAAGGPSLRCNRGPGRRFGDRALRQGRRGCDLGKGSWRSAYGPAPCSRRTRWT